MTILAKTCPHCGSHLIVREGQCGEFLACPRFPDCKYTEPIIGNVDYELYKSPSPYCENCNHTGLLPLKRKDSSIVPHTYLFCDCKEQEHNYYPHLRPEDFDFPMSYDFHRMLCREHSWSDPGPCEAPLPKVVTLSEPSLPTPKPNASEQLRGEIIHIHNEVHKLTESKPKKKHSYRY